MKRKTSKGKIIDFDALMASQSKRSPAIGNMGVNARGDRLGKNGEVLEDNASRVRAYYKDNPKSSTHNVSLKDPLNTPRDAPRTQQRSAVQPDPVAADLRSMAEPEAPEPDEFDAPLPGEELADTPTFKDPTSEDVEEIIEEKSKPKRSRKKKADPAEENTTVEVDLPEFSMEEQTTKIAEQPELHEEVDRFEESMAEEIADIEVMTDEGDILMMTQSQYEEYQRKQSSGDAGA